jgi:putative flippase GtrA
MAVLRQSVRDLAAWLARQVMLRKAASFAAIGVVNALVDACVFFLAYWALRRSAGAGTLLAAFGSPETLTLITANVLAWLVAVSGSYVMNSFITFAAESGRTLRLRSYGAFVGSGVAGVIANTATLVIAAQVMPVWAAKGLAILVSFAVNFSLSHFVVFRPR